MPTDIDLAYAAGFIDGEGYIGLRQDRYSLYWQICVGNTDVRVIMWFMDTFGGMYYIQKPNGMGYKSLYTWRLHGKKAEEFLEMINPFLKVKKVKRTKVYPLRFKQLLENRKEQ